MYGRLENFHPSSVAFTKFTKGLGSLFKHQKEVISRVTVLKFDSEWMCGEVRFRLFGILDHGSVEHVLKGRRGRVCMRRERQRVSGGRLVHPDRNNKRGQRALGPSIYAATSSQAA